MEPRTIATFPANELPIHRQFAELDSLYRRSPNGVGVLDHELRYVKANEALAELHGMPAEALAGRAVHELLLDVVMPRLGGAAAAKKAPRSISGTATHFHQRLFARSRRAHSKRPAKLGRLVREVLDSAEKSAGS
jgi:PAS domain-containing protein